MENEKMNFSGLALDAWIKSVPDDVYDLCPCGCGKKFRYVMKDYRELESHEMTFIKNYLTKICNPVFAI
jgi:hypothetical protein